MAAIVNCAPVKYIHGSLSTRDRFYFRILNGKQIAQRKPNRKQHVPTPNERANQQRFARDWAGRHPP